MSAPVCWLSTSQVSSWHVRESSTAHYTQHPRSARASLRLRGSRECSMVRWVRRAPCAMRGLAQVCVAAMLSGALKECTVALSPPAKYNVARVSVQASIDVSIPPPRPANSVKCVIPAHSSFCSPVCSAQTLLLRADASRSPHSMFSQLRSAASAPVQRQQILYATTCGYTAARQRRRSHKRQPMMRSIVITDRCYVVLLPCCCHAAHVVRDQACHPGPSSSWGRIPYVCVRGFDSRPHHWEQGKQQICSTRWRIPFR
jgi:hypothetical protein